MMLGSCLFFIILLHSVSAQWGYSQDEIDVFDLADEFKANFYEFLGISHDASSSEIRRSYRKLSLTMHPDKNKTEGAEENFRILAAVYEVLKNKEKREIYDNVLVNGIPSAYLYVPKQMRKMSLTEVSVIIALVFTCGHYLFMWGAYAEKRLALEELLPRIRKKQSKAKKKGDTRSAEDIEKLPHEALQKPQLLDILPIAILRGIYQLCKFLPGFIREHREEARRRKEEELQTKLEEEEAERQRELEQTKREEKKLLRKERIKEKREEMLKFVETSLPESGQYQPFTDSENTIEELEAMYDEWSDDDGHKRKRGKKKAEWSSEDESDLVRLMAKYPVGSSQRWQLIADELNKRVPEVITKAKQIRSTIGSGKAPAKQTLKPGKKVLAGISDEMATVRHDAYMNSSSQADETPPEKQEMAEDGQDDQDQWTQTQQKLLEMALQQFPKGTPERWDKIARCVPSKQKEECITRYKFLAEKIQQKRKQKS